MHTDITPTFVNAPGTPEFFTIEQAASQLEVTPWAVVQRIEAGELPTVRFGSLTLVSLIARVIPDPSTWGTVAPGAGETFDVDELTVVSSEALRALTVALDAINDVRGTTHTVESVAADLGMIPPLSVAEGSRIARHIGGVMMH